MKAIVNKTHKPIRVKLPGGKHLHLGPAKRGLISDKAVEQPSLQRMLEAGEIELEDEAGRPASGGDGSGAVRGSTHGKGKSTVVHKRGDR